MLKMTSNGDTFQLSTFMEAIKIKSKPTESGVQRDMSGRNAQYVATCIVNMVALSCGIFMSWSSSAHYKIKTTDDEWSWVCSLLPLGAVFGALSTGLISEYFGRRKTLLYLALPIVISWTLLASSPSVEGLYVGRFVGGAAMGAVSVAIPPYVADICETSMYDTLANIYHVFFASGVLIGYIIGPLVKNLVLYSVIASIFPIVFTIAFLFFPESPVYLMSQGKLLEAKIALQYFRGSHNDIDAELTKISEYIKSSLNNRATFGELIDKDSTRNALFILFGLITFQQLSGVYPIVFYAQRIFTTYDLDFLSPPVAATVFGTFLLFFTVFSSTVLSLFPRRSLLIISFLTMAMCTGTLGIYFHRKISTVPENVWIPLFVLCAYISMYSLGAGPIPWLMLRQIFPPNITRRATAILAGFHWFLAFIVTKIYQNLIRSMNIGWLVTFFAAISIVGMLFVYFLVPETKNRSLEDIQNDFEGKRRHTHIIEVECEFVS